jgi:hypothetical protein
VSSTVPIYVNPALLALALSGLALLVAWLTFRRAGDWRTSDAGKDTSDKLNRHGERLTILETRMENLATKSDIAELKGLYGALKAELDGVRGDASAAASGVVRIEQFLMDASQT